MKIDRELADHTLIALDWSKLWSQSCFFCLGQESSAGDTVHKLSDAQLAEHGNGLKPRRRKDEDQDQETSEEMSSFRPKTRSKNKYSNGLPQFYSYKDKTITNNYTGSQYLRLMKNFYARYKVLTKAFFVAIGLYMVLNWMFDTSVDYYSASSSPANGKNSAELWAQRKNEVKNVFLESWNDYVKHGWGMDVYSPVKQQGRNIGSKPLGWIIVDTLDTLMLMDCKEELEDAKSWVDKELDYNINSDVNVFETTIRMLGGLLSAHYLSNDDDTTYLEKAVHLGNKLVSAFDTPSGIPVMELNLQKEKPGRQGYPPLGASTAEIATLQLEFKYLSNLTGEAYFWDAAEKVMGILDSNQFSGTGTYNSEYDGLAPIYVNQHSGKFSKGLIRLGSRGDSYYEYLLKQYLQTKEEVYLDMYQHAFKGIKKHLVGHSQPNNLLFLGELPAGINGYLDPKMDHLVCFIGGLFALGATEGLTEVEARKQPWWDNFHEEQLKMGIELGKTCYHMYHDTPGTHLSPEIVVFNSDSNPEMEGRNTWSTKGDFYVKSADKHNLQRPETVETLYYLYKITGDIKYREWGWEIFQNFVKYTKVTDSNGKNPRYTSLKDCTVVPPVFADNMESFWLAETLKYIYLLFDDETGNSLGKLKNGKADKWDLRNIVFNTEAHPLPKFDKASFAKEWVRGVGPVLMQSQTESLVENAENIPKEKIEGKVEDDFAALKDNKDSEDSVLNKIEGSSVVMDQTGKKAEDIIDVRNDEFEEGLAIPEIAGEKPIANIPANADVSKKVADDLKSSGRKPVAKQPVAKPLDEQLEEAIDELELKGKVSGNGLKDSYDGIDAEDDNLAVADKMKQAGEIPEAKQKVAKPLDDQVKEVNKKIEKELEVSYDESPVDSVNEY